METNTLKKSIKAKVKLNVYNGMYGMHINDENYNGEAITISKEDAERMSKTFNLTINEIKD